MAKTARHARLPLGTAEPADLVSLAHESIQINPSDAREGFKDTLVATFRITDPEGKSLRLTIPVRFDAPTDVLAAFRAMVDDVSILGAADAAIGLHFSGSRGTVVDGDPPEVA
jgi:hypothetical protein